MNELLKNVDEEEKKITLKILQEIFNATGKEKGGS